MNRLRDLALLPPICLGSLVLYVVMQLVIAWALGDTRNDLLSLQLATSWYDFLDVLAAFTQEDILNFRNHLAYDILHPVVYSIFLCTALALAFRWADVPRSFDLLLWAGPLAGFLDEVENIAHIIAVDALPDPPMWTFLIGTPSALAKWLLVALHLLALPTLVIIGLIRRQRAAARS